MRAGRIRARVLDGEGGNVAVSFRMEVRVLCFALAHPKQSNGAQLPTKGKGRALLLPHLGILLVLPTMQTTQNHSIGKPKCPDMQKRCAPNRTLVELPVLYSV